MLPLLSVYILKYSTLSEIEKTQKILKKETKTLIMLEFKDKRH